jgi:predicted transcriptional regulator
MCGKAQKLDSSTVEKAKQLLNDGYKQRFIAALLGVSQPMICHINKGKRS